MRDNILIRLEISIDLRRMRLQITKCNMIDDPETVASRLRSARKRAGFRTQTEFAESIDVPQPTYNQHERGTRGKNGLDEVTAKKYAAALRVDWLWLLHGVGEREMTSQESAEPVGEMMPLSMAEQAWRRVCVRIAAEAIKRRHYPDDRIEEASDMLVDVLFSKALDSLKQGKSDADILHELQQNSAQ